MFIRLEVACERETCYRPIYVPVDDISKITLKSDEKDSSVKSAVKYY